MTGNAPGSPPGAGAAFCATITPSSVGRQPTPPTDHAAVAKRSSNATGAKTRIKPATTLVSRIKFAVPVMKIQNSAVHR